MGTLCSDIEDLKFSSKRTRIRKKENESGLGAFIRWIKAQANAWCAAGLCLNGKCEGHFKNTSLRILKNTDEYVEVKFQVTIFCRCSSKEGTTSEEDKGNSTADKPGSSTPPKPGNCNKAQEDAELQQMLGFYKSSVDNARQTGYQAANDPGYSDPGLGFHKPGNCVDWQQVSWSSLVTRTWNCWEVTKIRARQHWSIRTFHHFVKLRAPVSGRVIYLDPWSSGKPDHWAAADFDYEDGKGWAHTVTHTHKPGDKPRDPGND